jgi:amidase
MSAPLHYQSLTQLSEQLRQRQLSPVDAAQAMLGRIAQHDGAIHSFITLLPERALERAHQAEAEIMRGFWRGPLHGVPIAIKDLCDTSFAPSTAGMKVHANNIPNRDATVVERLERAGAVILGKLAMTEGAASVAHHATMPSPRNPWSAAHWAGASSSGSGAATAAGFCFGSLGSDTGGSIRVPSALCGLTGVKPTWGRVSRHGIAPLADSLDHVGPMTRTAADAAAILTVIAGRDERDPTSLAAPVPDYLSGLDQGISGLRLGFDERFIADGTDPEIMTVLHAAVEALTGRGARLVPVAMPNPDAMLPHWTKLCAVECAVAHRATYPSRAADYGPELAALIELGLTISGTAMAEIHIERQRYAGQLAAMFRDVDLIILPALIDPAPTNEEMPALIEEGILRVARHIAPFDMTGSPTITLHGGFDGAGVPIGFQLVGPHLSEDVLLRAGHAFQQATDWHSHHPAL